ncbi:hypothetical protein [Burkholderia savannae]|uniref:hypothetical protein n=1 Tax=Burkholderia savannae TaxID=1637837 RepID=UPI0012E37777|nr:hypothetical protein [Burkholderia savannae]
MRKLLSGSDREVFDFYDGTYSFSVSRQGSRDYAISFISDDLEVFAGVVDARDFEKKLVKKCDDFVQYIINGGIKYDGFSSFQKNLSSLKEEMGI